MHDILAHFLLPMIGLLVGVTVYVERMEVDDGDGSNE